MSNTELLTAEIKTLPKYYADEVLDFVGYLKGKAAKEQGKCPICAKYRDPITGELRFNAETLAAFEEENAMLHGEKPAEWYKSFTETLVDLDSDDSEPH